MTALADRVIKTIAEELGELHLSANRCTMIQTGYMLDDDLGVNSLDRVCIASALDEEFDIETPDDDVAKWETVGDIVATVRNLVGEDADA